MTQNKAIEILKSGANVFLTGQPGCGKTYTINKFVEERERRYGVAITASTGIAATHIGGVTIHSWAGLGDLLYDIEQGKEISDSKIREIANRRWILWKIRKTSVLVIDEVSMLPGVLLDIVDRICREAKGKEDEPFGGLQVILVGDMFQLPPVTKKGREVDFVYKSKAWKELNLKICNITERHRQEDDNYFEVLTAMRNGQLEQKHLDILKQRTKIEKDEAITKLFTHNGDVDYLNYTELEKLEGKPKEYKMTEGGNPNLVKILKKSCLSPEFLELKEGALVMFTRNNPDEGFVNGTLGKVSGFNQHGEPIISIKIDGEYTSQITPTRMEWVIKVDGQVEAWIEQMPLRLAWAITVHKSQGMSLDSAIIDLSSSFEYGQGYVALSRVKSLAGLFLEGLNDKALLMHPEIVEKDKEFMLKSKSNE